MLAKTANVAAVPLALSDGDFNGSVTVKVTTNFSQLGSASSPAPVYVNGGGTLDLGSATTAGQSVSSLDVRGGTVLTASNTLTLGGPVTALAVGTVSGSISGILSLGTAPRHVHCGR